MQARIEKCGEESVLRLPEEFNFLHDGQEVEIKQQRNALVLQPIPRKPWPESAKFSPCLAQISCKMAVCATS